ncbi:MAG: protein translocase subunit SecD [Gammaproteobacteria bacterium]|nr:protein translocase subunit SecD [Gammaproteobacteria bacterium]
MLNHYPWWKNLLIASAVLLVGLFAIPNFYAPDPALQISAGRNASVTIDTAGKVREALIAGGISPKSVAVEKERLLVRLTTDDEQLPARALVQQVLGDSYTVALNLAPTTPGWLDAIGGSPLKLGLDLRGGVHFLMEVDMKTAMEKAQSQMIDDFRSTLSEGGIKGVAMRRDRDNGVSLRFANAEQRDQGETLLAKRFLDLQFLPGVDARSLLALPTEARMKELREFAVQQNITILRNRVNQLGVAEPLVQRQGASRIVVELPGVQDTAEAKKILGATATLEFRMVDTENDLATAVGGRVPAGSELLSDRDGRPVLLKKRTVLTGDHIVGAGSSPDENGMPRVSIDLDGAGGSKMARETKDNIGKPMATLFIEFKGTGERDAQGNPVFVKKQEVINVATIQSRLGSSFQITGLDSPAEAHELALLLRAGALIAPIQIVEERTIGPSLGKENIERGIEAILLGFVVLVIFMGVYYRKFGLVANVALFANLVGIVGIMSMIPGAALTMPGMAGIVLTLGMAVDANVLIFERIREELRDGKSVQQAIHSGFDNAFSSIFDGNITTLITAVILFSVGSGPVRGFAVTLMIGIVVSMFTAIIVSRAIINSAWGGKRLDRLSI